MRGGRGAIAARGSIIGESAGNPAPEPSKPDIRDAAGSWALAATLRVSSFDPAAIRMRKKHSMEDNDLL
jgi:hypothetical protein